MENKDKPAFPESLAIDAAGDCFNSSYFDVGGLTKLEYAVIHNMPELDEVNIYKNQYDDHLTNKDVAKIKKTIKACRYALEALSNEE